MPKIDTIGSIFCLQTLAPVCSTSHCQGVCKPVSHGGLLCETNGEFAITKKNNSECYS